MLLFRDTLRGDIMKRLALRSCVVLFTAILPMALALAAGVGLTTADYRYLKAEFGLGADSFTFQNISADDAARLHQLINERAVVGTSRYYNVADYLFDVELRTCQNWQLTHGNQTCPQVTDPNAVAGWQVAERYCIACHLTGTTSAPSFFKLAQRGPIQEDRLATALRSGHQMSPMALAPEELQALARYINSLR